MNRTLKIAGMLILMVVGHTAAGITAARAQSTPVTIMPMGDSGTIGTDYYTVTAGGYRDSLYRDLIASGIKNFTYVGVNNDTNVFGSASRTLIEANQTNNNGFGGYEIIDIYNNLDGNVAAVDSLTSNQGGYWITGGGGTGRAAIHPTLILLEIGANDILQGATASTVESSLTSLIQKIHTLTPSTIVFVAGIYPFNESPTSAHNVEIQTYDSYIQNTLVPANSFTRYVDNHTAYFNADGTVNSLLLGTDNVHPTRYGYPVWGENWAQALRTYFSVSPALSSLSVTGGTVVNTSSASGSYPAGSVITINSGTPPTGDQFGSWSASTATTALSNPFYQIATYVVPAANSTVTAGYTATGSPIIPNGTYNIVGGSDEYQMPFSTGPNGFSIAAASAQIGSLVQQQTFTGASTQQWVLTNLPAGGNVVELSLPSTNYALEVTGASTTANATLDLAGYSSSTNQQWTITPQLGTTEIVNNNSGMAAAYGYNSTSGSNLEQEPAGYQTYQLWAFYPLSSSPPAAPTNLSATAGSGQVALSWTASSGATSYSVYRGTTGTGLANMAIIASNLTSTSYTDQALTGPPGVPTGLTATPGSGQVVLNWSATAGNATYYYEVVAIGSAGTISGGSNDANAAPTGGPAVASYNVYRGTSSYQESSTPVATGITSASYTDTGVTSGTTYYYYIAAVSVTGTSNGSGQVSAMPTGSGSAPAAPTGLTATAGNAQVALAWTASSGATSYNVYRGTSAGGESTTAFATGISGTTYSDTAVTNGTTYYYEVKAVNSAGTSGYSNEAHATPTAGSVPAAPTGLTATAGNAQVALAWTASSGATSYNVYRGTSAGGESTTAFATGISGTTYSDTTVTNGTTYYYEVKAVNSAGTSGYSNEAHATPTAGSVPAAPTGLTATAGNAQVALAWTASSGATSYNVYRGTTSGGESTTAIATGISGTTYSDTTATNGTTYYYEVKAVNSAGTSGYSNEASATPVAPGSGQISWSVATNMASDTDVASNGTAFDAATFYTAATTVNGVTFNPLSTSTTGGVQNASGNIAVTGYTGFPISPGGSYTAYAGGSANYNNVVSTLIFSQGGVGTGMTVTLSHLTSGHSYQVEVWAFDGNLSDHGSVTTQLSGATAPNGLINGAAASTAPAEGQFSKGAFTASSTSFAFQALQTQSFSVISAVSVRDITSGGSAPAAPTGLTATAGNAQVTLAWTASSGATSYNVYRGTTSGGESTAAIATGISGTTYSNTAVTNGTTYYYEVKAVNSAGTSGYSNEASATPVAPGSGQISWGVASNMSTDTDVASNGAAFDAADFYTASTTVNGVTFNPISTSISGGLQDSSGDIAVTGYTGFPLAPGGAYTAYAGGSASYNNTVSTLIFSQGGVGTGPTVTLSHLTAGHTYQVEVWAFDGKLADHGSVTTQLSGATAPNGLINGANSATAPADGQFVKGSFTAASTFFTFQALQTQSFSVINAISVRDTTP